MKFSYQVATPDLKISPHVTCMQGDFAANIQALASFGYDGAEIMTTYPKSIDWQWVRDVLADNGMTVSWICTGELGMLGYTLSEPDDALWEQSLARIRELVDLAALFGVGVNIGNTKGRYREGIPREKTYERAVEGFRRICDYAGDRGVDVAIETGAFVYTNFLNTCQEAAEMVRRVDRPNLGLMLDLWHLYVEEKSIVEAVEQYGPICHHVHLADSNRKYPGAGNLDFRPIFEKFREVGYDKAFSVEVRQVPDSITAAREAAKVIRPILHSVYH